MSEWTRVEDDVPALDEHVLVYTVGHLTRVGMRRDTGRWVALPGNWSCRVTHWQPLPAPPS